MLHHHLTLEETARKVLLGELLFSKKVFCSKPSTIKECMEASLALGYRRKSCGRTGRLQPALETAQGKAVVLKPPLQGMRGA